MAKHKPNRPNTAPRRSRSSRDLSSSTNRQRSTSRGDKSRSRQNSDADNEPDELSSCQNERTTSDVKAPAKQSVKQTFDNKAPAKQSVKQTFDNKAPAKQSVKQIFDNKAPAKHWVLLSHSQHSDLCLPIHLPKLHPSAQYLGKYVLCICLASNRTCR